jgi:hypothetical protein
MKKITYLIAVIAFALPAMKADSQITVTQADMPAVNDKIVVDSDLTPSVTPGNKGVSQVWNFSALKATKSITNEFIHPNWTPYSSDFPSANIADTMDGVAGYIFILSTSGAYSIAGVTQAAGYPAIAPFNPLFTQLVFPANYLNTFNGTAFAKTKPEAIAYPGYDSARANITIYYKDTIDAWGSMTSPAGVFNVLRVKHYEYDIDSIFLQDNSIFHTWAFSSLATPAPFHVCAYTWYANGIHTPIASMIIDTTYTHPKSVGWYSGIEGINELSDNSKTLVYPNPCTTQITFKYNTESAKHISVFDITGRQVTETTMENGSVSLNTSAYAKGIYLFQVNDKSGNMLDRGKFLVQ